MGNDFLTDVNQDTRYIEMAVEKYSKMLFRICLVILCNRADAEDALQETYLRYITKAPEFTGSEHEKAWLIKVATNVSKNMSRFRLSHPVMDLEEIKNVGIPTYDADVFETIMELPSKYKIVMDLYYIEGYKVSEISEIINVSAVAVRKRLQYARAMLKKEFERNDRNGLN